jgi:hypothetical protein
MNPKLKTELEQISGWTVPEHDVLEWLLERLPVPVSISHSLIDYVARYKTFDEMTVVPRNETASGQRRFELRAETPTDAAAKLAIALFHQDILVKEER